MKRTDTSQRTAFRFPAPAAVTFDFSISNNIQITIPKGSTWRVSPHWHSAEHEGCQKLIVEEGRIHVSDWKEPRTDEIRIGGGTFDFRPGYWTTWGLGWNKPQKIKVNLVTREENLYRNVLSATLDADLFPSLHSTPYWLRGVCAVLGSGRARSWLIAKLLYVQLQAMYYQHAYWEYHGGVNALSWWQWSHPFDIGNHPAWTVKLQFRSQRLFSRAIQGIYYWMGRMLGMKGDYLEYRGRMPASDEQDS